MDGTPIFDIKPYVSLADSHPDARCGFVDKNEIRRLRVEISDEVGEAFTAKQLSALVKVLELDPRPHYHHDAGKVYGMPYLSYDVRFKVDGDRLQVVGLAGR